MTDEEIRARVVSLAAPLPETELLEFARRIYDYVRQDDAARRLYAVRIASVSSSWPTLLAQADKIYRFMAEGGGAKTTRK